MFDGYKIISVTPAGRKEHLEILSKYLLSNRDIIDEHHWWLHTYNREDIAYMRSLCDQYPSFYKLINCKMSQISLASIHSFFPEYIDENTIYIRFDDDICYIAPDAVEKLLEARIKHPDFFVVYPHIINNKMNSVIHSVIRQNLPFTKDYYTDLDHVARVHDYCLSLPDMSELKTVSFVSKDGFNINSFAWFGSEFAKFGGRVGVSEEHWISEIAPHKFHKINYVCGDSVVIHYAYMTQREHLNHFDYLDRYRTLANLVNE